MRSGAILLLGLVACVNRAEAGSFLPDEKAPSHAARDEDAPDAAEAPNEIDLARATTPLATAVSASCALDAHGGAHCWGSNLDGALGTGAIDASFRSEPVPVRGLDHGVASLAGGNRAFCAVLEDGSVRCWGNLADARRAEPTVVPGIVETARISIGDGFACALDTHGHAKCWGAGGAGQLGNRSTDDRETPQKVISDEPFIDLSASPYSAFVCGVTASGRVLCWGSGEGGQLGRDERNRAVPAPVDGFVGDAVAIATGAFFACAVLKGGGVSCWGRGDEGQLGGGAPDGSYAPRRVPGIGSATAIALGERHACALMADGSVVCWGAAYGGAIPGQKTIAPPTNVLLAGSGITSIAAGYQSTCARTKSLRVTCFGSAGISWSADTSFTL